MGGVDYFWNIAVKIADNLAKIHKINIIHKDINPNNIIFNPETNRLSIIDFGISTVLTRETTSLKNPEFLEGTLAYISPEQTGRMNRSLDYRTDFYSLGATFYELLLGQVPFDTEDAMELVHAHIAKPPVPPCEINPEIPVALSDLVMKLLAKNAEDRYQSAYGIKADLEICWEQWQKSGTIAAFSLGSRDISDKFQIPQKLYGREREVTLLLEAFARAVSPESPGAEMMLVAGYSGIGKSALVQEIYKPITGSRGYFIAGKFDQLQRNIPYSALIKAFQELVRQILTENAADIAGWRSQLQGALGQQGQLIVDVIPELELILGPQPEVPELPPVEAQNRWNLLFQKFIKVFAQPAHPLALFLDDLQWADSASLTVMQLLMTETEPGLFVIGAYRENEVSPAHPLMLTVDAIASTGARVNRISLTPLELPHVNQLIADTLSCSVAATLPLAELVRVKTQGNPFFLTEFLKSLHAEKLIDFDGERGQWQWDLEAIAARNFTDNVVDLMAGKIQKLPVQTQELLQLAACIDHKFELHTLAAVSAKSLRSVVADLHPAVAEGLVFPLGEEYRFLELEAASTSEYLPELQPGATGLTVVCQFAHDRIQQAAYSLMPSQRQQAVHWQVGQMLLQNTPSHQLEQKIFTIVEQLNSGSALITTQEERHRLAQLNLMAGQKAAAAAAYQPAFNYLKAGIDLLPADSWQVQYQLTLKLHQLACEAAYLITDFEQMEQFAAGVMERATSVLDRVKVYEVKIQAYTGQNQFQEAISTGLEVLKLLGVTLPAKPSKLDILRGLAATKLALAGKKTEDLIHLPPMTDPYKQAAMGILSGLHSVAYLGCPELYPLIVFKQVILSLSGQTAASTSVYTAYGVILCGIVGDIDGGYRFGELGIRLLDRPESFSFKSKTIFTKILLLHIGKNISGKS
ncbi:serine/threonine-protein kinase PknK [[Phormidium] sp. ETS-05]|uniref:ATP-binding protein n=1 Tax=[Phormidium] sp. ETS-05 TaxID=222819 RepID=UPI0031FEE862